MMSTSCYTLCFLELLKSIWEPFYISSSMILHNRWSIFLTPRGLIIFSRFWFYIYPSFLKKQLLTFNQFFWVDCELSLLTRRQWPCAIDSRGIKGQCRHKELITTTKEMQLFEHFECKGHMFKWTLWLRFLSWICHNFSSLEYQHIS